MALAAGTHLGPYEILASIGAGGMGEVYRARDSKLDRDVAIKVLPAALAQDPERLARFEREAKVLASLNHPNIAQIYGVEERALVMELVAGETLKGPLPLDTALNYARQIADALEAAHEKNIIHRDLKPANIMITPAGVVKVLDFGLAAVTQPSDPSNPANSPTLTISPTRAGMILGTAAYMSPEQARGKVVDKRADIWAFGVVLFEMLTGQLLFEGETVSDTLSQVLTKEPDWEHVPSKVRRLLKKCLEKDPKKRLRDIGDAWELLELTSQPATSWRSRSSWLGWGIAAFFMIFAAALASPYLRQRLSAKSDFTSRFQIPLPDGVTSYAPVGQIGPFAVSPDGRRLVFATPTGLWIRNLDALDWHPLEGTEGASFFFWSPDSRFIAFSTQAKLRKMDVSGGPPQVICDVPAGFVGGTWNRDNVIVFGDFQGLMMQVSASGGAASPLTLSTNSFRTGSPSFLPDRKISSISVAAMPREAEESTSAPSIPSRRPKATSGFWRPILPRSPSLPKTATRSCCSCAMEPSWRRLSIPGAWS
jgi:serine/threonine protein kinase